MNYSVLIDYREHPDRRKNAGLYYAGQGDNVRVGDLLIGDYIFNNKVVFEYKTLTDFIKSVESNRVFNQCIDQSTNYPYHFLVIVADEDEKHALFDDAVYPCFGWANYEGAVARLNTFTTVIEKSSEEEAIRFMRVQARKCLDDKVVVKRLPRKTSNPAFNFLLNIKHVGDDTASLIVDELGLESLEDLLGVENNDLQGIDGIGSAKAGVVMRALHGQK